MKPGGAGCRDQASEKRGLVFPTLWQDCHLPDTSDRARRAAAGNRTCQGALPAALRRPLRPRMLPGRSGLLAGRGRARRAGPVARDVISGRLRCWTRRELARLRAAAGRVRGHPEGGSAAGLGRALGVGAVCGCAGSRGRRLARLCRAVGRTPSAAASAEPGTRDSCGQPEEEPAPLAGCVCPSRVRKRAEEEGREVPGSHGRRGWWPRRRRWRLEAAPGGGVGPTPPRSPRPAGV